MYVFKGGPGVKGRFGLTGDLGEEVTKIPIQRYIIPKKPLSVTFFLLITFRVQWVQKARKENLESRAFM